MVAKVNRDRFVLQFHITGRCNLNCKHCYREEGNAEPLSFKNITDVVDQFEVLSNRYNRENRIERKGQINLTGGEPFVREDISDIINYIGRKKLPFGILTNGTYINDRVIQCLKRNKVSIVQLSIDGDRETHDSLRAKGDYDRTFAVAQKLEENGVKTLISFTANSGNYNQLSIVADECRKRKISKLWSDRLVPIGNGKEIAELKITDKLLPLYIEELKAAQGDPLTRALHPKTEVSTERALQFLGTSGRVYNCSAGEGLIIVDEFGQVMPCRRLPIVCGNIFESTLEEIYYKNDLFRELRRKKVPPECEKCSYASVCGGGAKCQSYAEYGDFNKADPACPLKLDLNRTGM